MKPQDLLLGFRDILAVFVPGVVLLYAIALTVDHPRPASPVPGAETLVFAAMAYGIGSVAFAVGALLDYAHKPCGRLFVRGSRRDRLRVLEALACEEKRRIVDGVVGAPPELTDLWSNKSFWLDHIRLKCPVGLAELERIESTQKFFRTFTIVLIPIAAELIRQGRYGWATVAIASCLTCLLFYGFRRAEWDYRLLKWAFLSRV